MKKLVKICLIICAAFFLVGLIGVGVGAALGVRPGQVENALRDEYRTRYHYNWDDRWDDDWDDDFDHDDGHHYRQEELGPSGEYTDTFEGSVGDSEVKRLKLDLNASTVRIYLGDEDTIYAKAANAGKHFTWKQEGSILTIRDDRRAVHTNERPLKLELYLPPNTFDEIELDLGAGEFYAEKLNADRLEIDLGAGEFHVKEASVNNKAEFDVGTGELIVDYFQGGSLDLDCGVGNLEIQVAGSYGDYNYDVDCGIGSIQIGDNEFTGLGREQKIDSQAEKQMDIDCGVGTITVSYTE